MFLLICLKLKTIINIEILAYLSQNCNHLPFLLLSPKKHGYSPEIVKTLKYVVHKSNKKNRQPLF